MADKNLDAARQLIKEQHYDQARAILSMTNSPEARALLKRIKTLERDARGPSVFRWPNILMLLIGTLIPVVIAYILLTRFAGAGGSSVLPPATQAISSSLPLAASATCSSTATPSATSTATPTPTATASFTPSATRSLPATWTPTSVQALPTANLTGTALAQVVATGEFFVAATQTVSARQQFTGSANDQVLGIVGTPDEACQRELAHLVAQRPLGRRRYLLQAG